ncbi:MAG: hypothetical protein JXQ90_01365 [Cyclobacteriaceae bacterium]
MHTISKKVHIASVLMWPVFLIGWSVPNFIYMKNAPDQQWFFLKINVVYWVFWVLVSQLVLRMKLRPIDKLIENVKQLSNEELKRLSRKTLNLPIYISLKSAIMYLVMGGSWYFIFRYFGVGPFGSFTVVIMDIAGIVCVSTSLFFLHGYILQSTNRMISEHLHRRGLSSRGTRLSVMTKSLGGLVLSIFGIAILILGLTYYYAINHAIDIRLKDHSEELQYMYQNYPIDFDQHSNNEIGNSLERPDRITAIVDRSGEIIYSTQDVDWHLPFWSGLNEQLLDDFVNGRAGSRYDNVHGQLLAYHPYGDYSLVFVSKLDTILSEFNNFWYLVLFVLGLGMAVCAVIAISFAKWMSSAILLLSDRMLAISVGDLTQIVGHDAEDETSGLASSYNRIVGKLTEIVTQIKSSSNEVFETSQKLGDVSKEVSRGANEQASTTEEIAASMEEMLATISSNMEIAKATADSASRSASGISDSNKSFEEAIAAVTDITHRIELISDIARKTDILSLNAAVEAARAGDHGKGFAVVAQEIRKLADKSGQVSTEIEEQASGSRNISELAGEKLRKIVPEIVTSAEKVNSIANATQEQKNGVENINDAVQLLSEITANTASSAEVMSGSSLELEGHAAQLKKVIAMFKTA